MYCIGQSWCTLAMKNIGMCFYKCDPNQKHPSCKKSRGQDLKKGCDKEDVKSKGAAKACAGMLLITLKILIMMTQATKQDFTF